MDILIKQIEIITEEQNYVARNNGNGYWQVGDIKVYLKREENGIVINLTALNSAVKFVKLELENPLPDSFEVCGDAWERSYGDLCFRQLTEGYFPWYCFIKDRDKMFAYGVKTNPSALCKWLIKNNKLYLIADVCNGTHGFCSNGRTVKICTAICEEYCKTDYNAVSADFCEKMSDCVILPKHKVYGFNNWYYAYGISSQKEIIEDTRFLVKLTEGFENRPYMVIDDGWSRYSAAPWNELKESFSDMEALAREIKALNVRPGIWVRPLYCKGECPQEWVLRKNENEQSVVFDFSRKDCMEYIKSIIKMIKAWGYELLKYDFTTYDIFGVFGFQQEDFSSVGDWRFYDKTKTNAELIRELYVAIREAAGDMILIGCNTLSHLIAGCVEIQRTGDDTSGVEWERTKKMGINTLAFRMCQNNAFYTIDADCVGIGDKIDWNKNRQWLELLAYSGTPLFVSVKPETVNQEQFTEIRNAMRVNSEQKDICFPLDYGQTKTPAEWMVNGERKKFRFE